MKKFGSLMLALALAMVGFGTVGCQEAADTTESATDAAEDAAEDTADAAEDAAEDVADAADDAAE